MHPTEVIKLSHLSNEDKAWSTYNFWIREIKTNIAPNISDIKLRIASVKIMKTKAGIAYTHNNTIVLNEYFIETEIESMCLDTIPHEFAHIITEYRYGKNIAPHGKEWQLVAALEFGIEPSTYHNYDMAPLLLTKEITNRQYYQYRCNCKTHLISSVVHNRILKGQTRICKSCNQKIVLIPLEDIL